jgi:hypothetical protein
VPPFYTGRRMQTLAHPPRQCQTGSGASPDRSPEGGETAGRAPARRSAGGWVARLRVRGSGRGRVVDPARPGLGNTARLCAPWPRFAPLSERAMVRANSGSSARVDRDAVRQRPARGHSTRHGPLPGDGAGQ